MSDIRNNPYNQQIRRTPTILETFRRRPTQNISMEEDKHRRDDTIC